MRKINDAGLSLIKSFEKCRLDAYDDGFGIITIGYGHTGSTVRLGQKISEHEASVILDYDLEKTETAVEAAAPGLSDNQFAACVSLAFNIGAGAFKASKLCAYLNKGQFQRASDQFQLWDHVRGKEVTGLTRRREAERELFLAP